MKGLVVSLVALVLLSGCASETRIAVYGTRGMGFTGKCVGTNGEGRAFSENLAGVVPREFVIRARDFNFAVRKKGADSLVVNVRNGGASEATAGARGGQRGVRGRVTWWGISVETF